MHILENNTALKQTAQNILDAAVALGIQEINAHPSVMELNWKRIRSRVTIRCNELIRMGIINSFVLQEINTEDVDGWTIAQGQGKVFTLWLETPMSAIPSEPKAVVYQI